MKKLLTISLSIIFSSASAQWSNTTNYFEDTLHMPVSTALLVQKNPIILTSYPDNGYFVIWEDDRNYTTTKTDIYAQKYDKAGNRLWASDGIPIANGPNTQHYTFSSNQDYRNRSFVATDSAGGFYICYSDDSVSNYVWERLMVQHVRSNGSLVFASPGYIIARSNSANLQMASQIIPDGNKGFFIAYLQISVNQYVEINCYKDENGTMEFYGGGRMNENALQTSSIAPCGIKTDVIYPSTTVSEFNIWSDNDGGCNVIINMSGNNGAQGKILAFNKLWRAKKDSKVKTFFRNASGSACPRTTEYRKGDVYLLYTIRTDYQTVTCGGGGGPVYAYTNYRLLSNGYFVIDNSAYDYYYPKGVTLTTTGNINADLIAVSRRTYTNNILSDFTIQGYQYKAEKFDSVPYQRTSYNNPDFGYNTNEPTQLNKLNFFRDTILGISNYYPDFTLAAGGSHIYAAGLLGNSGTRLVRLQNLELVKNGTDSFALEYKTNILSTPEKYGVAIGSEINTGFSGFNISYDQPLITINNKGKALFYIREYYRSARVSPIGSGAELSWGAMGRPIGAGVYNGIYYNLEIPVAMIDSTAGSGIIAWRDNKNIPGNTSENIFMRHLDKLDALNYLPPVKKVKSLYSSSSETVANPAVLFGTSKKYSTIEVYNSYNNIGVSPIVDIKDNNYLGRIQARVYQQVGAIRKYNEQPYLNRNYTFISDSVPPNAKIDMLLYFTTEEFNTLKEADNSIGDPSYLYVIRQPNAIVSAPAVYTPVAGEELITPISWDSVEGGYFINIESSGLGNFFIQKIPTITLCSATNTSFSSNVTGVSYFWQVDAGGGFSTIINNSNYSGANSATLQVNNIPSSFNGYRYRCVIDNSKVSINYYLQVANIWTGTVNNLWENAGNWSCGTVPDANTDVIINSGTVSVNSNATCRSIKISIGASLNVSPGFNMAIMH